MKKVILVATICVAGLVSAKTAKNLKPTKEVEKKEALEVKEIQDSKKATKKINCRTIGMLVWCTDTMLSDTVCWGPGSGTATEEQAMSESLHNSQLVNEFFCGGQP